jgi:hypothetical protein
LPATGWSACAASAPVRVDDRLPQQYTLFSPLSAIGEVRHNWIITRPEINGDIK